ncbi:MAG: HDOD domain-containing protein [Steroidobacteraceae bacterium]|jgi:EAL and modified HD-GYP domain-containing signal transduction protein|nr:HDOD domain-containing protein [Steroidobacteraceae bacterium]
MNLQQHAGLGLPAIARQPIFDLEERLYGYELLYRRGTAAETTDGDEMTARVMVGALAGTDLELLSAQRPVFINATRTLLMGDLLRLLAPQRVILEILENVEPDPSLLARLADLAARGYRFALDDVLDLEPRRPFLDFVEIIKVDVAGAGIGRLAAQADELQATGKLLLAEKVETPEEHASLYAMGFHLFQGYFFARPEQTGPTGIPTNKLVVMQLLAKVADPGITLQELATIIQTDVALSLGVLRWANSPLSGLRSKVDSIERAVIVLGIETVRSLVSLLALARLGTTPSELLTLILVRARLCELLARASGEPNPATYFMVGLLSGLDAVMNRPMETVLRDLPIDAPVALALLAREGALGATLAAVERLEAGAFDAFGLPTVGIDEACALYRDAVRWATEINLLVPSAGSRRPAASSA